MRKYLINWLLPAGLSLLGMGLVYQGLAGENPSNGGILAKVFHLKTAPSEAVRQPLAFDHEAHIRAEKMECADCHRFATAGPYATLPKLKDCRDCHSEPQGQHPDEAAVREYAKKGMEIPWITVNRLPGHVYFSHRAHVVDGKMDCWDCHRDMRKEKQAAMNSDIKALTMSRCMACHEARHAKNDCLTCHK